MDEKLKSNIWKFFLIKLCNRRNYIPILSIYFLTLPDSTAQQIGLYVGIGWLVGFLAEIPSGYVADLFGHKKTIILGKIFMLTSSLLFVLGNSLIYFILGSSFIALGFAFSSGTYSAFLHNTLIGLKREKEYGVLHGKIDANVSLASAVMILSLPFLTEISIVMPIMAYLMLDVLGLLLSFTLFTPVIKYCVEDKKGENILSQLKKFKGTGFYLTSIFFGLLGGLLFGLTPYKEPFVQSLGMPVIFIGSIMGVSRIIWFLVGHNLKLLKKIPIKRLMLIEIFVFPGLIIFASQITNPYFVAAIFALLMGYYFGRMSLIEEYYIDNFLVNKRFKATMLSIKQQIRKLFDTIIIFSVGFLMVESYSLGFFVTGIIILILLIILYVIVRKVMK
ncbi:hypothetical protein K9L97_02250 [Candidatus Woesearchaeota archaeon]|nr:hypothetical protein [Candidatus Woesearchaeota archaeon]